MGYVTDTTSLDGTYESIYSFRTGKRGPVQKIENADTCDKKLTLLNPFTFHITWKTRTLNVREYYMYKRGKRRYKLVKRSLPYPRYQFEKQSRSVREWRLILKAGLAAGAIAESNDFELPHVTRVLGYLLKALAKFPKCELLKYRDASQQHPCVHTVSTIDAFPSSRVATVDTAEGPISVLHKSYYAYYYRFWEPLGTNGFVGTRNEAGLPSTGIQDFRDQLTQKLIGEPLSELFEEDTIETVATMLWPDSSDFEDIASEPLIDIAEAVSDGKGFPLGEPPDPIDATKMIEKNIIDDKTLKALSKVIDFSANLWLWKALVVEPLISSATGLAASVIANDKAIEAYAKKAKDEKWYKGKNLQLYDNLKDCKDIETEFKESDVKTVDDPARGVYESKSISFNVDIKKTEANALFVYRLSEFDAAVMRTSGAQLSQYFQRMSTSLDQVLHNVLALSFVYDWFTSNYSGELNLKNKVLCQFKTGN